LGSKENGGGRSVRSVKGGEAKSSEVKGEGALFGEAESFAEGTWVSAAEVKGFSRGGKGEVA